MNRLVSARRLSRERGFSLIELLIVIAIIMLIMAIAIPQYNKSKEAGQELVATEEMRTIMSQETAYFSLFGKYATLAQLGPPAQGAQDGPNADGLIPAGLASGSSGGYNFTVAVTQNGSGYTINASPKIFNSTGRRTFFADETNVIHQNFGQDPATANSPELK